MYMSNIISGSQKYAFLLIEGNPLSSTMKYIVKYKNILLMAIMYGGIMQWTDSENGRVNS